MEIDDDPDALDMIATKATAAAVAAMDRHRLNPQDDGLVRAKRYFELSARYRDKAQYLREQQGRSET